MKLPQIENEREKRIRVGDRVTIFVRGKRGTYTADFWIHGQHRHRSLKTSNFKIARQRAILLECELATGEYTAQGKPVSTMDARQQYMASVRAAGRSRKTILAYEFETKSFVEFLSSSGVHLLTQITPKHFLAYRAQRQIHCEQKTVYTRLLIIKSFINWCSGAGALLKTNPLRVCKVAPPYVSPKFTPSLEQVNAILSVTTGARRIQCATLAFGGFRVTEMAMLRPEDVDLKSGWIRVVGRAGWVPKTRQARKVPIHPRLKDLLQTYTSSLHNLAERAYFFSDHGNGGRPINVREINVDLQILAKKLDIPIGRKANGLVIHSLRHYFETQCVDSGVPQFVVDAWMGHTGQAQMGRSYYGFTEEKSIRFMQQVRF
jgi:integrase